MPVREQPVAQMRAQKSRSTGHQYLLRHDLFLVWLWMFAHSYRTSGDSQSPKCQSTWRRGESRCVATRPTSLSNSTHNDRDAYPRSHAR